MRVLALVLGVSLILWLPLEDVSERGVVLFASLICSWWAVRLLFGVYPGVKWFVLRHLFSGVSAGLAVSPVALLLIAFKTGLHGHGTSDFTPEQVQYVLLRAPIWAASGLLISLGLALWRLAQSSE